MEWGCGVMEQGRGVTELGGMAEGRGRKQALGAVVEGGVGEGVGLGVLGARDVAD